jgi:hypothetical protein
MKDIQTGQSELNTSTSEPPGDWGLANAVQRLEEIPEEQLIASDERASDSSEEGEEAMTGAPRRRPKYWGLALVLLILVGGAVVAVVGAWQRGNLLSLLYRFASRPTPEVVFLESQQERSLFLESDGKRNRVLIQGPDRESWLLVSRDDYTAANPALSPDGLWVAYLSTQDAPKIVVVPLEQQGRLNYASSDLEDFGRRSDIEVASICPWTPIAWAMDSARLAFFGCAEDPALSRAFVATLADSGATLKLELIPGTVAPGTDSRQILWMGDDRVSVTFPPGDPSQAETVRTLSVD